MVFLAVYPAIGSVPAWDAGTTSNMNKTATSALNIYVSSVESRLCYQLLETDRTVKTLPVFAIFGKSSLKLLFLGGIFNCQTTDTFSFRQFPIYQGKQYQKLVRYRRHTPPPLSVVTAPRRGEFIALSKQAYGASARIKSEAFSPIMTIGALVFPETRRGMMEPSAILSLSMPRTLSSGVTTELLPVPMEQVPTG